MTAKQFVRNMYPTARAEKQTTGKTKGFTRTYWLIRMAGATMYFSEGTSESNAWVNAKKRIIDNDNF